MAGVPVTFVGEVFYSDRGVGGGPMPGGPPLGIWGGRPPAYVDIGGPGPQPGPSHPIVIPPDAIAPGVPTHPIYLPVYPAHPIVIPPDSLAPGVPTHPIYLPPSIWPPGCGIDMPAHPIVIPPDAISPGVPTHPIVLPPVPPLGIWGGPIDPYPDIGGPGPQPPGDRQPLVEWKICWTPSTGWVVIGVPTMPHVTPSKK